MKIKNIVNPNKVYQGFYEAYFIRPFFTHYLDFKGHESGSSALFSFLAWLIATLGIIGVLTGLVGLLGPEVGFSALYIVGGIWLLYSLIPIIAIIVRLANGPGRKSQDNQPRMLGIDWILTIISLLFFICGMLMMITTLNSEILDPNAGYVEESEASDSIEAERVVEEPIFTYQDAPTSADKTPVDSLAAPEEEDADLLPPEESFDPTIEAPVALDTIAE